MCNSAKLPLFIIPKTDCVASEINEASAMFYRYELKSLKGNTKINRQRVLSLFHLLGAVPLFLLIRIKKELTGYLSKKLSNYLKKDYFVV